MMEITVDSRSVQTASHGFDRNLPLFQRETKY
jgi:hypothetical protein